MTEEHVQMEKLGNHKNINKYKRKITSYYSIAKISGNFLMKCTTEENGAWKVDVVACVLDDGSRLELNDHKPVGNDEFSCAVAPDGSVSLRQMVNANAGCGTHPVGDVWREGNFEFECQRRGQQILRACITDCNLRIKAGEQISADGQEIKSSFENRRKASWSCTVL
uniref:CVNH domain-containing protein n=1 Tax=Syphacia muris TaxID=451379 RepID=A0A0N5AEK1_9BILA